MRAAVFPAALFIVLVLNAPALTGPLLGHSTPSVRSPYGLGAATANRLLPLAAKSLTGKGGPGAHPLACENRVPQSRAAPCLPHGASLPPGGGSGLGWTLLGAGFARYSVGMAYDVADGYVLGFGFGLSANETWRFLNGSWLNLTGTLPTAPTGRLGFGFAYDGALAQIVLFGGAPLRSTAALRETWTYSRGAWTNATNLSAPTPPASVNPAIAYDGANGSVVLYGGATSGALSLWQNDTWIWASSGWSPVYGVNKIPRIAGPSLAYDPVDAYSLLIGGGVDGTPFGVYSFVGGHWTNRTSGAAPLGPGRAFAAAAWSPSPQELFVFGGEYLGPGGVVHVRNDTWGFLNGSWSSFPSGANAPAGRAMATASTDLADRCVVLTGGIGSENATFDDTWTWNGSWGGLPPPPQPGGRDGSSLIYDARDGYVVLFGGGGLNETWRYSLGSWIELFPAHAPSPREMASTAYDAVDGEVVLFGGTEFSGGGPSTVTFNDTWTFANGQWANISNVAGGPAPRSDPSMTYDSTLGEVVLFGGVAAATGRPLAETWTFSSNRWVNRTSTSGAPPPARSSAAVADDPLDRSAALFGGIGPGGSPLGDTWVYVNGSWTPLHPSISPTPRGAASSSFDTAIGAVLLFGGTSAACSLPSAGCGGPALNDTWYFAGGRWANQTSLLAGAPRPRADAGLVDDELDGYLVLFGGVARFDDAWQYLPITFGPLAAATPTASTNPGVTGAPIVFAENATGGTPPYAYVWTGLPFGCVGSDQPSVVCTPSRVGVTTIHVIVNDSFNASVTSLGLTFTVLAPNPLVRLSVSLPIVVLTPGSLVQETATAWGANGSALGSGVSFTWTTAGGIGHLNATTGPAVELTAGPVPVFGQLTVQANTSAASAAATANVTVETGPFQVSVVDVRPSVQVLGQEVNISARVSGGVPPYSISYAGLPAGCTSLNSTSITCTPTETGSFTIDVSGRDAAGDSAHGTATFSIRSSSPTLPALLIAGIGVATAALLLASLLYSIRLRRRRLGRPDEPRTFTEEGRAESVGPAKSNGAGEVDQRQA